MLHWAVEYASAVYLDGEGVVGHDTRQVCPESSRTYTLHVEAPQGGGDWHVAISVNVPADTSPPSAPSPSVPANGLALDCRGTQVLAWMPVSDPSGIAGYHVRLEYQVTPKQWKPAKEWPLVSGKQVEAPVQCGLNYRWSVRAQDGAGNWSAWSTWSHFAVGFD